MIKTLKGFTVVAAASSALLLAGCETTPTRIQAGGPTALTTMGVDLADFKTTAGEMVSEMLGSSAIGGFEQRKGRKPLLNVGEIVNNSDINMDMGQLAGRINEDLLNSGLVELVANDAGAVDSATENDWENDSKKSSAQKPDLFLEGRIMLLTAKEGRAREKNYTFQLRLNDAKTRKTVWQKTVDMAKQGTKSSVGW